MGPSLRQPLQAFFFYLCLSIHSAWESAIKAEAGPLVGPMLL